MKKYLFLAISILSIFFITDRVDALSFTVNNKEIEVTEENLIYYLYSQKKELFDSYDYYYVVDSGSTYYSIYFTNYSNFTYITSMYRYGCYNANTENQCIYIVNTVSKSDFIFSNTSTTEVTKTSRFSVSNYGTAHVIFSNYENLTNNNYDYSLVSKQKLIDFFGVKPTYKIIYYLNDEIYQEIEVEEGTSHELLSYEYNENLYNFSGWQYDENVDLNNITSDITIKATFTEKELIPVYIEFPINKNEYYALLIEVAVLIMIIFLKWCFPFKGGSDLR